MNEQRNLSRNPILILAAMLLACSGDEGSAATEDGADGSTSSPTTTTSASTTLDSGSQTTPGTSETAPGDTTDPDTTQGSSGTAAESSTAAETLETTGVPEDCADGVLTLQQGVMGTTRGGGDDFGSSCAPDDHSEDRVYEFVADSAGVYRFENLVAMHEFDSIMSIVTDCGGTELVCNDDASFTIGNGPSELIVRLEADQHIWIVIDGKDGATGEFDLNAHYLGADVAVECWPMGYDMQACEEPAAGPPTADGSLPCNFSAGTDFTGDEYELEVEAGDCVYVWGDNVDFFGTPGAQTEGLIIELFQDELAYAAFNNDVPCTVPSFFGDGCPAGGATAMQTGTMRIVVAGLVGCNAPGGVMNYRLRATVNGVDVALGDAAALDVSCG